MKKMDSNSLALGDGIKAIENRIQNRNNKFFKEG